MDVLLRAIVRAALRRGLAGNLTWLAIAVFAIVLRRALWDRATARHVAPRLSGRAAADLGDRRPVRRATVEAEP